MNNPLMSMPNAGNMGVMQNAKKKKKPNGTLTAPGRFGAGAGTATGGYAPYRPTGLPAGFSHGIR
jgi:hypothetical protein